MGLYFVPSGNFLSTSGGTVSGNTIFLSGLTATSISGEYIYSGDTNLGEILQNLGDGYLPINGGIGGEYYFTGNTTAETLNVETLLEPTQDNVVDLGTNSKRFRNLVSGKGFVSNFTADTITVEASIKPRQDAVVDLGSNTNRFRSLYTQEGIATNFTATTLSLGTKTVTEYSIILTGDTVYGGIF